MFFTEQIDHIPCTEKYPGCIDSPGCTKLLYRHLFLPSPTIPLPPFLSPRCSLDSILISQSTRGTPAPIPWLFATLPRGLACRQPLGIAARATRSWKEFPCAQAVVSWLGSTATAATVTPKSIILSFQRQLNDAFGPDNAYYYKECK